MQSNVATKRSLPSEVPNKKGDEISHTRRLYNTAPAYNGENAAHFLAAIMKGNCNDGMQNSTAPVHNGEHAEHFVKETKITQGHTHAGLGQFGIHDGSSQMNMGVSSEGKRARDPVFQARQIAR